MRAIVVAIALTTAGCSGCFENAEANGRRMRHEPALALSAVTDSGVHPDAAAPPDSGPPTAPLTPPYELASGSLSLHVHSHATNYMYQGVSNASAYLHSTANGHRVDYLYDLSNDANLLGGTSNNGGPTLGSGIAGAATYLVFASTHRLSVSLSNTENWLGSTGIGTLVVKFGTAANGVLYVIADSANQNQAVRGFTIQKTVANTVRFQVMRSSAGNPTFDHTTAATVLTADGIICYAVQVDNANGGRHRVGRNGSWEDFARGNAPSVGLANGELGIGRSTTGVNGLNGQIAALYFSEQYLSEADINSLCDYNPARTSASQDRVLAAANGDYSGLRYWYRFTSTAGLFQDSACTTAVTVNGNPIGCIESGVNPARATRRLTQSTNGFRPVYRGNNGAEFDGSDDAMVSTSELPASAHGWTRYIVARNDDTTDGSNWNGEAGGTGARIRFNGASNPAGTGWLLLNASMDQGLTQLTTNDGYNLIEAARDGGDWVFATNGANERTTTDSVLWSSGTSHGMSGASGYQPHGRLCEVRYYLGRHTAAQREYVRGQIRSGLAGACAGF